MRKNLFYALVRVASGAELEFKASLAERRLFAYIPMATNITKPKRKHSPVISKSPLIPGYAFVLTTARHGEIKAIQKAPGYIQIFVEGDEDVIPVYIDEIETFRKRELNGEFENLKQNARSLQVLNVGDKVKILDGPMVGRFGFVDDIYKERSKAIAQITVENKALKIQLCVLEKIEV